MAKSMKEKRWIIYEIWAMSMGHQLNYINKTSYEAIFKIFISHQIFQQN